LNLQLQCQRCSRLERLYSGENNLYYKNGQRY
jgi:hypothetical protein